MILIIIKVFLLQIKLKECKLILTSCKLGTEDSAHLAGRNRTLEVFWFSRILRRQIVLVHFMKSLSYIQLSHV